MYMKSVYLDNAATTPVNLKVVSAMHPYFTRIFGNPSSPHALGEAAQKAMQDARRMLAKGIGAQPWEIVFTSGGTEANNLAISGITRAESVRKKIIISAIEHSSVWELVELLKNKGYTIEDFEKPQSPLSNRFETKRIFDSRGAQKSAISDDPRGTSKLEGYSKLSIVIIPVTREGIVNYDVLEHEIDAETLLVSIIHVNNEIGTIQDIARIGALCHAKGAYFHTDAVQSFGKLPIDVKKFNIDLMSASAHKIGGPKGIGLLYIRENIPIRPLIVGGGQERRMRGGTENVASIVGFAKANEITKKLSTTKVKSSRDKLLQELEKLGGIPNSPSEQCIYTTINIHFPNVDADLLVMKLSHLGVYCSTRSACLSKQKEENRILGAIGLSNVVQKSSLRLTLHTPLTAREQKQAVRAFKIALS